MELSTLVSSSTAQSLVLVPLVLAAIGAIKKTGYLPSRYAPIASMAVGVGLALGLNATWLVGLLAGWAASGLYDAADSIT